MNRPYELSSFMLNSIYTTQIAKNTLDKHESQTSPFAIVIGGQPGSGKTCFVNHLKRSLETDDVLVIDLDDLRLYHPNYQQLVREDDQSADTKVNGSAIHWVSRLMGDAIDKRCNLIIDQSSQYAGALENLFTRLRSAGYRSEFHVLAVPEAVSEFRVCLRYDKKHSANQHGRLVGQEFHENAFMGLADSLAVVEQKKLADKICVYNRSRELIYTNQLIDGQWEERPRGLRTFLTERDRDLPLRESFELLTGWGDLITKAEQRQEAQAFQARLVSNYNTSRIAHLATIAKSASEPCVMTHEGIVRVPPPASWAYELPQRNFSAAAFAIQHLTYFCDPRSQSHHTLPEPQPEPASTHSPQAPTPPPSTYSP